MGFAAETNDVVANARVKLEAKGIDLLVANDVSRRDIGFEVEWALAQDGVQRLLLLLAHESSPISAPRPRALAQYAAERYCVPQGNSRARGPFV